MYWTHSISIYACMRTEPGMCLGTSFQQDDVRESHMWLHCIAAIKNTPAMCEQGGVEGAGY